MKQEYLIIIFVPKAKNKNEFSEECKELIKLLRGVAILSELVECRIIKVKKIHK